MVSQTGWSPVPLTTRRRRGREFPARASRRSCVGSVGTGPRDTTTMLSAAKAVKVGDHSPGVVLLCTVDSLQFDTKRRDYGIKYLCYIRNLQYDD